MPNWLIKAAIHRAISWLPQSQYWNHLLQRHITKSTDLTSVMVDAKLAECERILSSYRAGGGKTADFTVLELGTGWHPVIPVGMFLCGAGTIHTFDIDPLLTTRQIRSLIEMILAKSLAGELAGTLPSLQSGRLDQLKSLSNCSDMEPLEQLLARIGIHASVADARQTSLPGESVDCVFSSGVLEYIPRAILSDLFGEFHRILRETGTMIHRINLADQYSSFDSNITPFNFLKYPSRQWNWLNSPLIWQNRLRISDYRALIQEKGFRITGDESTNGSMEDLDRINPADEFKHYQKEDLLTIHSYLVARRTNP